MFSVAQLSYTGAVAWSMSPAFLAYAKMPLLQGVSGFEGAEGTHSHRLHSSSSELFTPQLQLNLDLISIGIPL